jgi:hypothetical protein
MRLRNVDTRKIPLSGPAKCDTFGFAVCKELHTLEHFMKTIPGSTLASA